MAISCHLSIIFNGILLTAFRKRKLFGSWQKTMETGSSGATLLLHNSLRAFKFPDESQIYLKCDIEVSRLQKHGSYAKSDSNNLIHCFGFFCCCCLILPFHFY